MLRLTLSVKGKRASCLNITFYIAKSLAVGYTCRFMAILVEKRYKTTLPGLLWSLRVKNRLQDDFL
jgi:hypothetical protein